MQPIEQTGLPDALRSQYDSLKRAFSVAYPVLWSDADSEPEAYRAAEQPEAIGRVLVCSVHRHLRNREIGYLYRQKMERNGKTVLGKASKVGSKLAYFSNLEFLIEINWSAWAGLTARQRIALVDHELCHLGIEDTEEGEKLLMIPHDLEEFGSVVQRWGLWQPDVANFAKICQQRDLLREELKLPRHLRAAAIHASPPCQANLKGLAAVNRGLGRDYNHVDLLPETRALLIEFGAPYVIEQPQMGAKLIDPAVVCGSSFRLPIRRHRQFESNRPLVAARCDHSWQTEKKYWTGWRKNGERQRATVVQVYGNGADRHEWGPALGIDWMTHEELTQAIPPAYTEFLGRQLIAFTPSARERGA